MDELEFYDGAWTGQEIDAGIGLTGTLANALAVVVDGNKSSVSATIGQYVLVKNSTITGIADGLYIAAKALPANTTLDGTYFSSAVTAGGLNDLKAALNAQKTIYVVGTISPSQLYIDNANVTADMVPVSVTFGTDAKKVLGSYMVSVSAGRITFSLSSNNLISGSTTVTVVLTAAGTNNQSRYFYRPAEPRVVQPTIVEPDYYELVSYDTQVLNGLLFGNVVVKCIQTASSNLNIIKYNMLSKPAYGWQIGMVSGQWDRVPSNIWRLYCFASASTNNKLTLAGPAPTLGQYITIIFALPVAESP